MRRKEDVSVCGGHGVEGKMESFYTVTSFKFKCK